MRLGDQNLCDVRACFGVQHEEWEIPGSPIPQLRNSDVSLVCRVIKATSGIPLDEDGFRRLG